MKLKRVSPIIAMLLVGLMSGCNKNSVEKSLSPGMSSETMSAALQQKAGNLAVVNHGVAGDFVILSKTGITDIPTSAITGDVGSSAISGAAIHVTCAEVTGTIYSVDAAGPLPCVVTDATRLTTAVGDMGTAYTDAAGRATSLPLADYLNLGGGTIGASTATLAPGVYTWESALDITGDITLNGGPDAVYIFQVNGTLDMASAAKIILSGGAQAKNIFWQVTDVVTLGTTSHFEGIILGQTLIALKTGASINGRLLAQTEVTLEANAVTIPAFVPAKGLKSIKFGPIHVVAQEDIGSCNNVWAYDTFDKVYTITANGYGTYNVNVKYNHGTFVTVAGKSPGACVISDNSNTVAAGIKGDMEQEYNGTVTGTLIPGAKCTSGTCVDTQSILNILFNPGWSWTILSDGGHWTWTGKS